MLPSPAIAQLPNRSLAHGGFLSQCRARKRLKTSPGVAWTRAPWRKNKILLMVPMKSHECQYNSYILYKIGYIQMIYPKAKKPSNHGSRSNPGRRAVVPAHFEARVVTSESVQHLDETPETEVEVGEIKGSKKMQKIGKSPSLSSLNQRTIIGPVSMSHTVSHYQRLKSIKIR